jgi:hypothetical protein
MPQICNSSITKTFSKLTGYLLILLACGTRIPQIRKIVKNKSVEGLSLYSIIFEVKKIILRHLINISW